MKIIAEIGSVHDGSFGNACKLIELAARCGADIVKFQTHISNAETLRDAPMPAYFQGEPRYEYFERTAFSTSQWRSLRKECENNGVEFISSPFSIAAAELLETIGVGIFKIASGEVNNWHLLKYIANLSKPVVLSSGMSSWSQLDNAVDILKDVPELTVMQCTSSYPCPPERVGLNVLEQIRQRYGDKIILGFSDHTSGVAAGAAAAALGAKIIEKHLTFSKAMYGSDAANALEPTDFALYCQTVRAVWTMVTHPVDKDDLSPFEEMKLVFEKSIVSARPIAAGTVIQETDLDFKKPGNGIPAAQCDDVVGRRVRSDVSANHKFCWKDFE